MRSSWAVLYPQLSTFSEMICQNNWIFVFEDDALKKSGEVIIFNLINTVVIRSGEARRWWFSGETRLMERFRYVGIQ
jgi:hypothetical protein